MTPLPLHNDERVVMVPRSRVLFGGSVAHRRASEFTGTIMADWSVEQATSASPKALATASLTTSTNLHEDTFRAAVMPCLQLCCSQNRHDSDILGLVCVQSAILPRFHPPPCVPTKHRLVLFIFTL